MSKKKLMILWSFRQYSEVELRDKIVLQVFTQPQTNKPSIEEFKILAILNLYILKNVNK